MNQSIDIDLSEYTPFERVSDESLLKATLFNRCRLSDTGCWEWTSHKRNGYGLFYVESKSKSAHRVSYELFKGQIPKGFVVRHKCDNPGCVNPAHLLVGTMKDNAMDRESRGRRDVKGEQIGTSKLTAGDVLEIRASSEDHKVLAERYGVSHHHIWNVRSGKSWKHLENVNAR